MAIDAAIASNATDVIREATGSVRPAAEWEGVEALVRQINEAIDRGDDARVARLTAELESLGGPHPAQGRQGSAAKVAIVFVAVLGGLIGIASVLSGSNDGDDSTAGSELSDAAATTITGDPDMAFEDPSEAIDDDVAEVVLGPDGNLEIVLRWSAPSDLDLAAYEPHNPQIISLESASTETKGRHSGDAAGTDCAYQEPPLGRQEVISWPGNADAGIYEIIVTGYAVCGLGDYSLTITSGRQPVSLQGAVAQGDDHRVVLDASSPMDTGSSATSANEGPATTETGGSANEDEQADEAGSGSKSGFPVAAGIAAVIVLVSVAIVAAWLLVKRRRPASDKVDEQADSPSVKLPRLPASDEIIELANHTIHRLGLGAP
jgi:hypothetical protein